MPKADRGVLKGQYDDRAEFELLDPDSTNIDLRNVLNGQSLPIHRQYINVFNGRGVAIGDINNEGLEDLYVCLALSMNPKERENLLYINLGQNRFEERREECGIKDNGFSIQPGFFDFDRDGTFTDVTSESGIQNYGWTLSIITSDFNEDGWIVR